YMLPLGEIIHKHGIKFHCYADDTQLYISAKPNDTDTISKIEDCVNDIKNWMSCNFLLLNSGKTGVLLVGSKAARDKLSNLVLNLNTFSVTPSPDVKNLGVTIDSDLSFDTHVNNITRVVFYHLRNISKIRNILSVNDAEKLIHAFITSRLDYCNALLTGCSGRSINKLQLVQNAAARVLTRTKKFDHISPVLSSLHWMPVKFRIDYKILLLTYKALHGLAPQYLSELINHYNPARSLHSQDAGLLIVPKIKKITAGGRAFSYKAPQLWNNLPASVRDSDTVSMFKSRLKTYLFSQIPQNHSLKSVYDLLEEEKFEIFLEVTLNWMGQFTSSWYEVTESPPSALERDIYMYLVSMQQHQALLITTSTAMADESFKAEFLSAHNEYRKNHRVPNLTLSKELCGSAQTWADYLLSIKTLQHSDTNHGENLYYFMSSSPKKLTGCNE
ncbi:uncharacterized protein LOC134311857, partial [Trichomycterus rosablanca]|uniref:uncharacterized protein LOC134311857 n=1 Tax=Trichomycterus rosablanca TaxID=2290929 RepID=UPI002F35BE0F